MGSILGVGGGSLASEKPDSSCPRKEPSLTHHPTPRAAGPHVSGGACAGAALRGLAFRSVQQVEGGESRTGSSLSLARARPPSEVSNGTSKSSSHAKGQRASSTYHRQRRHSDFCKWPVPLPSLGHQGPLWETRCESPSPRQGPWAVPKTFHGILACRPQPFS